MRVDHDEISGWGEASPNAYYRETAASVSGRLSAASSFLSGLRLGTVGDLAAAWEAIWKIVAPSRAAQCAIDLALWDWLARRNDTTVAELAWNEPARPLRTFCTIGLSTPGELREKIDELAGFPFIKIKSDSSVDLAPLEMLRAASKAVIAVDANCAWGAVDLSLIALELSRHGVVFLEQPFPPSRDGELRPGNGLPLMADESCVVEMDVERIGERFDGFNIKLVKCGGLTPALRMAKRGRELGLRTMVGCMLESSILIAAGAIVAQQTDYADLDGAWLLGDDPFTGWTFRQGLLSPPAALGLGVAPRPGVMPGFHLPPLCGTPQAHIADPEDGTITGS